jgi:hypothetical protein
MRRRRPIEAAPFAPLVVGGLIAGALIACGAPSAATAAESTLSAGERLYRSGATADGSGAPAVVQHDIRVTSVEMPCAGCHRRSGWGAAEGSVVVPPVAAPALFAPVTKGGREMGSLRDTGPGTRPAYTNATLLRAIREGTDPRGRPLLAAMPRYALGDADAVALVAYLRSLSAVPPEGVTDSELHLATITSTGASAAERQAALDVLRAYVADKNAETRNESRRRERGPWDMKAHYRGFRSWRLHEWELRGPSTEWPRQLDTFYAARPVFAVIGGVVEQDWTPVHEFAERHRLPVLLPQTPLPAVRPASESFYTFYYSRGVQLEADALVEHLARDPAPRLLQLSRCGDSGQAAAARVSARSPDRLQVESRCLAPDDSPREAVRALEPGVPLVLWLAPADAAAALSTLAGSADAVYLSATLLGNEPPRVPATIAERTLLLQPFVPSSELDRHAVRALAWLRAKGLAEGSRRVAVNTLHAAVLAADALKHATSLASRDYFVERVEAMASRSAIRPAYPESVFGPQRRFGSEKCEVARLAADTRARHGEAKAWTTAHP